MKMLDVNGDDVRGASVAAKKSLLMLCIFAILFAFILIAERSFYQSGMQTVALRREHASAASAAILLADEKLTMSALAYAGTADPAMKARYESALPQIDDAISDARTIATPAQARQFDQQTRLANDNLVKLETQAFDLASKGETHGARAIFNSSEYARHKKILAEGTHAMLSAIDANIARETAAVSLTRKIILGLMGLLASLSFATLVRRVRKSLNSSEKAFFSAMGEMEASEKEAIAKARRDAMVGLPNRVFLLEALQQELKLKREMALMFVDLDGFKTVNDTYGHEAGDLLLQTVATTLSAVVGKRGLTARLGGDEFAILITGKDAESQAIAIAASINSIFSTQFDMNGRIANVGASIGIATMIGDSVTADEFMRRADVAMYEAKASGRNMTRAFDPELDVKRRDDHAIATEMRDLITAGDFDVAYQPIVESTRAQVIGVEVLARWPSSSKRDLIPDIFVKIAEEHGLIDALGAWVLDRACRDIAPMSGIRLAVNISPLQLNNPNFISSLVAIAGRHDFPLTRLDIELTENVLIKYPERAKQVIAEIQALGVTVSLDDFGTGFASVGYLRAFSFNSVKLDRSLTHAILNDAGAQQVVQGTIMIANGLSATTVAEGVETGAESDIMRILGCKQLQGYYYGRPSALENLPQFGDVINPDSRAVG
jgi:diguanylate cyclase (GGDEF)-like protein